MLIFIFIFIFMLIFMFIFIFRYSASLFGLLTVPVFDRSCLQDWVAAAAEEEESADDPSDPDWLDTDGTEAEDSRRLAEAMERVNNRVAEVGQVIDHRPPRTSDSRPWTPVFTG